MRRKQTAKKEEKKSMRPRGEIRDLGKKGEARKPEVTDREVPSPEITEE